MLGRSDRYAAFAPVGLRFKKEYIVPTDFMIIVTTLIALLRQTDVAMGWFTGRPRLTKCLHIQRAWLYTPITAK